MDKDLLEASKDIDKFIERLKKEMSDVGKEIGELLEQKVKDAIETQSLPLEGLTPEWAKYKEAHGLDPRTLIATGDMVNSITFSFEPGEVESGHIGNLSLDGSMKWLALAHEFGLGTNKARPFITPTVEGMKEEADAIIQKGLEKALKG